MRKKSLIVALIVLFYDQLIKIIINSSFYYGKLTTIIPNFFYLTKVYNDGAAWSALRGSTYLLIGVAILSFALLFWYEKSFAHKKRTIIGFGLAFGGLLGNMIDRIMYSYVIDYFKVNLGTYEFPIFNLADIAIVVGFGLIIMAMIKGEDKSELKSR